MRLYFVTYSTKITGFPIIAPLRWSVYLSWKQAMLTDVQLYGYFLLRTFGEIPDNKLHHFYDQYSVL